MGCENNAVNSADTESRKENYPYVFWLTLKKSYNELRAFK